MRFKTIVVSWMAGFVGAAISAAILFRMAGPSLPRFGTFLPILFVFSGVTVLVQFFMDRRERIRQVAELTEQMDAVEGGGEAVCALGVSTQDPYLSSVAARFNSLVSGWQGQRSSLAAERARVQGQLQVQSEELTRALAALAEEGRQRERCELQMRQTVAEFEERVRRRTEELSRSNEALVEEINQRTQAESALKRLHLELEERVRERTFELALANEMLVKEIDDRRQAEGERQKLVSLVENANDFIALATLDGQITFLNDAAQKLLGVDGNRHTFLLSVDQMEGELSQGVFLGLILPEVVARGAWEGEIQLRNFADPSRRVATEVSAILVRDHESAKPLCFALILRDITERRAAEAALKELEERFSKAFHASPAAIAIITAREGRFIDVNRTFLSSFGYDDQEVNGRTVEEIRLWLAPDSKTRLVEMVGQQRSVREYQCRWLTKSGQTRDIQVAAEAIELARQDCLLVVAEDITERLKLEDQLRQSQKMEAVGQLAAGIAHDFNNILTVVQGHASLLLSDGALPKSSSESVKCVSTAADRAANLTRQLLTFSRKQVAQWRELDLNKVVLNLSEMLRRLVRENITLSLHLKDGLPCVRGDVNMLEQVILNLVVNARDAMPKEGNLVIDTVLQEVDAETVRKNPKARTGQFICLTVMDTGCGMDAATLERIFEPFFTTKEFGQGTGLGLATVYGVVTQHNGWIDVTSQIGLGSLFRVYLPATSLPPLKTEPIPEKAPEVRGGNETVLVVEDEIGLRMLVEAVLLRQGYRVLLAEHGVEALKIWNVHSGKIDLLLTDMVMPEGLTGLELSERLRVEKADLRVIYMSGYSVDFMENEVTGVQEGFNFLQKPYRPEQLVLAVRSVLDATPQPLPKRSEAPPAQAA